MVDSKAVQHESVRGGASGVFAARHGAAAGMIERRLGFPERRRGESAMMDGACMPFYLRQQAKGSPEH